MNNPRGSSTHPLPPPGVIVALLATLGFLAAGLGVVFALWWGFFQGPFPQRIISPGVDAILFLLAGVTVAAGCWAGTLLLRRQYEQSRRLAHLEDKISSAIEGPALPAEPVTQMHAAPALSSADPETLRQILEHLDDLRASVLLSETDRQEKRRRLAAQQATRQAELAREHLAAGRLEEADAALARLASDFPDEPSLAPLREQLTAARKRRTEEAVRGQVQRASDLMAVARFDEALGVATDLASAHPDQQDAMTLLERVKREAQTFELEQRKRLMSEVHAAADARTWRHALAVAHRLKEKYPDSPEAGQIRGLLPTIVDNARIEEVRELRDRFLDMVDRRRYAEAVQTAHQIITDFPETAAAEELRPQMPRLQDLAARRT